MGCCGGSAPSSSGDTLAPIYMEIEQKRHDDLVPYIFEAFWDDEQVVIVSAKAQVRLVPGTTGPPEMEITCIIALDGLSVQVSDWDPITIAPKCYTWELELVVLLFGSPRKLTYVSGPFHVLQETAQ